MIFRPQKTDDARVDVNFEQLRQRAILVREIVTDFVNATSAAQSRYLPDGNTQGDKDYLFVKTDASANTVTLYPTSPQLISATTSLVLAAQGDSARLTFDRASQTWWPT